MSKILQIIPVEGLYAKVIRTEEEDVVYKKDGGGKMFDTKLVPVRGEWGMPEYDYYSVVCLALIETDDGQKIHPLIVDDSDEPGTNLIDVTEWEGWYQGLTYYDGCDESSDSITIVQQDGTGFVTMPKDKMLIRVQHKLDPDEKVPVRISCMIDGRDITLGLYSDEGAAELAYHKLVNDMEYRDKVHMPSSQQMDAEWTQKREHEAYLNARSKNSEINTTFTDKTAEVLIRTAKCYTLEDVESLTKDEIMTRMKSGGHRRKPETCEYVINELQEKGYLSDNA